jgi:hypothetical protein
MAVNIDGDGLIELGGTSTTQGRLRLKEDTDNGTNYVELQAPPNLASDVTFVLPDTDGTNGQALITNGSGALSFGTIATGGDYVLQTFTSPGTWTKPTGLKKVKVTVVGAGGNGGAGVFNAGTEVNRAGGNGGGGGGSIEYIPAPSIPGPVTVTVGSAPSKTSSFGAFLSATGGTNGANAPGPGASAPLGPYAGGTGSGGDINIPGGDGSGTAAAPGSITGDSGAAALGFGAAISAVAAPAVAGKLYGGGGTGRSGGPAPGAPAPGGDGGAGIVIVEEFY